MYELQTSSSKPPNLHKLPSIMYYIIIVSFGVENKLRVLSANSIVFKTDVQNREIIHIQ